jgi:hypothetical protein
VGKEVDPDSDRAQFAGGLADERSRSRGVQAQSGDKTGDAATHHDDLHVFSLVFGVRRLPERRCEPHAGVSVGRRARRTRHGPP